MTERKKKERKKSGEERDSDSQSYYIIRCKCSVFRGKKITTHKKKQGSMAHSKGKVNQQKLSPKKT
jgi:hypothetical protein